MIDRNVVISASPTKSQLHAEVYEIASTLSARLLPRTTAYHEIWLDKKLVAGNAIQDFEPFYGESYLPRKVIGPFELMCYFDFANCNWSLKLQ